MLFVLCCGLVWNFFNFYATAHKSYGIGKQNGYY